MENYPGKKKVFLKELEYWQTELGSAIHAKNTERIKHCENKVRRAQKKVDNPEEHAGY